MVTHLEDGFISEMHWLFSIFLSIPSTRVLYSLFRCVQYDSDRRIIHSCVHSLLQVVQSHAGQIDRLKQRKIPVVWFGIAQEVRLMGSFDNWTQGFSLSAEEFSDGTFTKFQAVLRLVPVSGSYRGPYNPQAFLKATFWHILRCCMLINNCQVARSHTS